MKPPKLIPGNRYELSGKTVSYIGSSDPYLGFGYWVWDRANDFYTNLDEVAVEQLVELSGPEPGDLFTMFREVCEGHTDHTYTTDGYWKCLDSHEAG